MITVSYEGLGVLGRVPSLLEKFPALSSCLERFEYSFAKGNLPNPSSLVVRYRNYEDPSETKTLLSSYACDPQRGTCENCEAYYERKIFLLFDSDDTYLGEAWHQFFEKSPNSISVGGSLLSHATCATIIEVEEPDNLCITVHSAPFYLEPWLNEQEHDPETALNSSIAAGYNKGSFEIAEEHFPFVSIEQIHNCIRKKYSAAFEQAGLSPDFVMAEFWGKCTAVELKTIVEAIDDYRLTYQSFAKGNGNYRTEGVFVDSNFNPVEYNSAGSDCSIVMFYYE